MHEVVCIICPRCTVEPIYVESMLSPRKARRRRLYSVIPSHLVHLALNCITKF